MDVPQILQAYGFPPGTPVLPFGSGLINHTWKVGAQKPFYLLQRVNQFVFKHPWQIADNIHNIGRYLAQTHPDYFFVRPLCALNGAELVHLPQWGYFRMFPFVEQTHSLDVVQTPEQAFEAAVQFGRFTRNLSGFDARSLHLTIPQFHDLELRYQQFETALAINTPRRQAAAPLLDELKKLKGIVARYRQITAAADFHIRVTHHDTKISNVLFDEKDKGRCVIDLDTVMPGYFISDVGDMMRTYLSPVSEEEKDITKVTVRRPFYEAIVAGYMQEMHHQLSASEKASFFYAGQFMIYMQALRFAADYLNNDVYYGARYPTQNLVRAQNQMALLQRMFDLEKELAAK